METQQAIDSQLISMKDVDAVINRQYDLSQLIFSFNEEMEYETEKKKEYDEEQEWYEKEKLGLKSKIVKNTLEFQLAEYCHQNNLSPFVCSDMTIGRTTRDGTFDVLNQDEFAKRAETQSLAVIAELYDVRNEQVLSQESGGEGHVCMGGLEVAQWTINDRGIVLETYDGLLLTTIDCSKEYQALYDFYEYKSPDVNQNWYIKDMPEKIVNLCDERKSLREALAARCVSYDKKPLFAERYMAYDAEQPSKLTSRISRMQPGMSLQVNGEDAGVIIEVARENDIRIIETEKYLMVSGEYMDFSNEYNKLRHSMGHTQNNRDGKDSLDDQDGLDEIVF
jgi:hypothetical protein